MGPKLYRSQRVLLDGKIRAAGILVTEDGTIARVLQIEDEPRQPCSIHDFGDLVLMPGLVDSHVHLNEPGRTHWEGFWTGTRAAAAGGVTTVVDMPLNSIPPTTSVRALNLKRSVAQGQCHVDLAFWGGLVPDNITNLPALVAEGVAGFKCFLIESGVDEFPAVNEREVDVALQTLKGTNCPLLFHAELDTQHGEKFDWAEGSDKYAQFLASRPAEMEVKAVELVARLCQKYRTPCHIVHVSAAEVLDVLGSAQAHGAPLTAETCPHYLSLSAETVPRGATQFKCCPPIRSAHNKEQLWAGVLAKKLQLVVSDHSPCSPDLKRLEDCDFQAAWGGISSLQLGLSLVWTQGRERGLTIADVATLMSSNPAKLSGLHHRKGKLAPGYDADFVIWNPDEQFPVTESMLHHRHKLTPYANLSLFGKVHCTVLRGQIVYQDGSFPTPPVGIQLHANHGV